MNNASKWILGILATFFGFAILILALSVYTFTTALVELGKTEEYDYSFGTSSESVGVIELKSVITSSEEIVRQFRKYQKNKNIRAIVLRVDSPGGAVAPSQEIYEEVRKTRDAGKPVVISMGSVAASGGYYVSLGASKIVANPGTITGSIGVISQFTNLSGLLKKIGIENTTIKSGKYKDAGSPFRDMTEEEKTYWQSTINNVYEQFITAVAKERKISLDSVKLIGDGRVYTGEQAYKLRLVDTLGTFQTAISIAGTLGKIQGEPRIQKERKPLSLFEQIMGSELSSKVKNIPTSFEPSVALEYRLLTK